MVVQNELNAMAVQIREAEELIRAPGGDVVVPEEQVDGDKIVMQAATSTMFEYEFYSPFAYPVKDDVAPVRRPMHTEWFMDHRDGRMLRQLRQFG
eukprot:scaffold1722_cov380-Prasinococcus_capsulatus_cf.AAC.11